MPTPLLPARTGDPDPWDLALMALTRAASAGVPEVQAEGRISVTRQFQAVLRAGRLPRQRFRDLRHACAWFLLAQGVPAL